MKKALSIFGLACIFSFNSYAEIVCTNGQDTLIFAENPYEYSGDSFLGKVSVQSIPGTTLESSFTFERKTLRRPTMHPMVIRLGDENESRPAYEVVTYFQGGNALFSIQVDPSGFYPGQPYRRVFFKIGGFNLSLDCS